MKLYKEGVEDDTRYIVSTTGYNANKVVNEFLYEMWTKGLKISTIGTKGRMIVDYFNFLENRELDFAIVREQEVADFLMWLRCPDGIKLDRVNYSQLAETKLINM